MKDVHRFRVDRVHLVLKEIFLETLATFFGTLAKGLAEICHDVVGAIKKIKMVRNRF